MKLLFLKDLWKHHLRGESMPLKENKNQLKNQIPSVF